jgi:CDP-paratose 2-epimerase
LIGSESVAYFVEAGYDVIGFENDGRARFFGGEASTQDITQRLTAQYPEFRSLEIDIRDPDAVSRAFLGAGVALVIHSAAQPSHDWAAPDPQTDFGVNANRTLNLLEATRDHASEATSIFTSTNKVYLFGVSKVSSDLLAQEYGRYFGLRTVCFRCGCLTGPNHAGTRLHGFLSYLMRCTMTDTGYTVVGYGGQRVRDNIHSADPVSAFAEFHRAPRIAAVYNMGGRCRGNCWNGRPTPSSGSARRSLCVKTSPAADCGGLSTSAHALAIIDAESVIRAGSSATIRPGRCRTTCVQASGRSTNRTRYGGRWGALR